MIFLETHYYAYVRYNYNYNSECGLFYSPCFFLQTVRYLRDCDKQRSSVLIVES